MPNGLGNYWTADDMNGVTHVIQDDLNENKAVLVDISAHWCGPCFTLHQSHSMAEFIMILVLMVQMR